ncbi:MAG: PilZ domain-containing protein [Desulfatitalea sp.]
MSHTMLFGERRLHDRMSCAFSIHIEDDDRSYSANLLDLSIGGAFLEPPVHFNPKVGQELRLTIPFRKRPGVVVVKGRIAYARRDGLAIVFLKRRHHPSDGSRD